MSPRPDAPSSPQEVLIDRLAALLVASFRREPQADAEADRASGPDTNARRGRLVPPAGVSSR